MYEHKKQPLLKWKIFFQRLFNHFLFALLILMISLGIGIFGYHYFANIAWLDAVHNSSMILSGMGPVVEITTVSGKWFSSAYALFSGIVFISTAGVILAPVIHRVFHRLLQEK